MVGGDGFELLMLLRCAFVWVGGGGYGDESAGYGSSETVHHSLTGKKAKSSQRCTKQPTAFSQH